MYQTYVKRALDLILSLLAVIVLAIPMGVIALWIKPGSPRPGGFPPRPGGRAIFIPDFVLIFQYGSAYK